MELKGVHNYSGAQYPVLGDYLAEKQRARGVPLLTLAAALAMLATLLGGCTNIS